MWSDGYYFVFDRRQWWWHRETGRGAQWGTRRVNRMFGWTFRLQQRLININHKKLWKSINVKWCLLAGIVYCLLTQYRNTYKYLSLCLEIIIEHWFFFSLFQNRTWFSQIPSERKERVAIATIQLKNNGTRLEKFDQIPSNISILLSHNF